MITLYHNTRCSKSRDALALLEQSGKPYTVVEYLKTPLDVQTLQSICTKGGFSAKQLLRSKEPEFIALGLDNESLNDSQLLAAIVSQPRLLERHILFVDEQAAIGRPLSNIAALLA